MRNVQSTRDLDEDLYLYDRARRAEKYAKKARPPMRTVCAGCDHFRLCRDNGGAWQCTECAPCSD